MGLSLTTGNACAFLANLLSSSLKQQETPGFEVLQRRSLCYHISAAAMLPVKLCSTWAEKLPCHTKHPFPGQKKKLSLLTCWFLFLTYVLSHIIFPYLLIKIQHDLNNSPPFITILEPCYKIKYTTDKMIWMSRHISVYIYICIRSVLGYCLDFRLLYYIKIILIHWSLLCAIFCG